MRSIKKLALASALVAVALPAQAGEITGNGKDIEFHAATECAFSGLNDLDGDPRDPGLKTQSYGTLVGQADWIDPQDLDPNSDAFFVPIPGFACNPTRWAP